MNCCNNSGKEQKNSTNKMSEEKGKSWLYWTIALFLLGLLFFSVFAL